MRSTASRTRRQRLSKQARRELIVAAGARVFADRGYAGATLAHIASEAGIVKSVVYDHFGSKQELYIDLLRQHADELMSTVFDAEASGTAEQRFRSRTEAFFAFVEHDRFAWRMLFRDPPTGDPTVEAFHASIHARARDAIREQLSTAPVSFSAEVPRRLASEIAAHAIKAINDGLAAWWYDHPDVTRETVCGIAVSLAWQGIGTGAS